MSSTVTPTTTWMATGLVAALSAYARPSLAGCQSDMECKGDRVCQQGECVAPPKPAGAVPVLTEDASGSSPSSSVPSPAPAPAPATTAGPVLPASAAPEARSEEAHADAHELTAPRIWVGLSAGIDFFGVPSANDVCKLNASGTGSYSAGNPYLCLTSGGAAFPGNSAAANQAIAIGHADQAQGGLTRGPVLVSASFDYALNANLLLGARLGFEALTIPSNAAFAPLRIEARLSYLVGNEAISAAVAPLLLVGAGLGEFDSYVPVTVFSSNPTVPSVQVNAWTTAGPAFLVAGAGARFSPTDRVALIAALKLQGAFGGTAGFLPGFAPELGVQVGF